MTGRPLTVFLIAGEASGDRLGAALMRGLRAEAGADVVFSGVGGAAMAAEGLESLFPVTDIAVMGLAEVLPKLRTILARIRETAAAVVAERPDILVTIDAPDFGLRVAERARRAGASAFLAHYVAPSVWAWRPKRAEKMAKRTQHLLALLPFEPPYFDLVGLPCDFVGHSVVEATAAIDRADPSFRAAHGLSPETPLLAALPGSRRGEVERLSPVFAEAIAALAEKRPGLRVVIPAAEQIVDLVAEKTKGWPGDPILLDPRGLPFAAAERRKLQAMAAANAALAASGTVSLELAAMRTPMAIAYRTSWLTAAIAKRLLLVDTATLVNLVSETRAVPEFIQDRCQPIPIADALDALFDETSDGARAQAAAAEITMTRLGEGDAPPSVRAARSVLRAYERAKAGA